MQLIQVFGGLRGLGSKVEQLGTATRLAIPELPILLIGTIMLSFVGRNWRFFRRLPSEVVDVVRGARRDLVERAEDCEGYPWSPAAWLKALPGTLLWAVSDPLDDWRESQHEAYQSSLGFRGLVAVAGVGAVLLVGWRAAGSTLLGPAAPGAWLPTSAWVVLTCVAFERVIGAFLEREYGDHQ